MIRNALGQRDGLISLADDFRSDLAKTIELEIPRDAWWAIDYHIDWLAGALVHHARNKGAIGNRLTDPVPNSEDGVPISGTQEDFDFVVAFGTTIILIEAKFSTGWSRSQLESKVDRLRALARIDPAVAIHFALMAPNNMKDVHLPDLRRQGSLVRNKNGRPYFLELRTDGKSKDFLAVERCDAQHNADRNGTFWQLRPWPKST